MEPKKNSSFIERMRQAANGKARRQFTSMEMQTLLAKARTDLENRAMFVGTQMSNEVSRLNGYSEIIENDEYQIVQNVAAKIVEYRALKVIARLLRKLQDRADKLVQSRGNVEIIPEETLWFQHVLWIRKMKNCAELQSISLFCRQFYRGVDIVQDSSLENKLYTEVKQAILKPQEIPFDMIISELQAVLNQVHGYPLDRRARMINLNRQKIEVLRVLMDEQRIANETPTPGNSVIRGQAKVVRNQAVDSPIIKNLEPAKLENAKSQNDLPSHPDEAYSISLLRKFNTGQGTLFPDQLRVQIFQK